MPCSRTQHGLTRVGLEPPTSGSGVRGVLEDVQFDLNLGAVRVGQSFAGDGS